MALIRLAGVVVLANMFTESGVDDIGIHLLDSSVPLAAAPKPREDIAVDADTLERYVGLCELAPGFILSVTREGDRLFTQATGQQWSRRSTGPNVPALAVMFDGQP